MVFRVLSVRGVEIRKKKKNMHLSRSCWVERGEEDANGQVL